MTRLAKFRALVLSILALLIVSAPVFTQNDNRRTTIAITYPLDQTISVPFRGTTRLPRLKDDARSEGRAVAAPELLDIDNLPRACELGGVYDVFAWAISRTGMSITWARSNAAAADSSIQIDVTTPPRPSR
jgi:hypothetical protein